MKFNRSRIIQIGIHVLGWCMLVVFPVLTASKEVNSVVSPVHIWLPITEAAVIFYINYLVLIEKLLFNKRRYVAFLVVNLSLIGLFRLDMYIIHLFSAPDLKVDRIGHEGRHEAEPLSFIRSLFALAIPMLLALGVKVTEVWRRFELDRSEVENKALESELKNLKYQLQPHFFFNSLNNIYSLVELSPARAQEAIHNLSKMMRYLLYETNHEKVDLAVEINFIKTYTQLMELRQSPDVSTDYKFPDILPNEFFIAPLMLVPVVENAYKHGVSATGRSVILFDLSMDGNVLLFNACNSNNPKSSADAIGSGIGLENLKRRLYLMYPDRHRLLTEIKENMFCLTLSIQLDKLK